MNMAREARKIEAALDNYQAWLDRVPDNLFAVTPPMGGWSYAEVYSHILKADLMCASAADKCINKTCEPTKAARNFLGALILVSGRFPPVRIKVPKQFAEKNPAVKISKEEATRMIVKLRSKVQGLIPVINQSIPDYKIKHPRLGMLNAKEWLKFIRIHSNHHLKQLQRIEKNFINT